MKEALMKRNHDLVMVNHQHENLDTQGIVHLGLLHLFHKDQVASKLLRSSCLGKHGKEQARENYGQVLVVLNPGYHSDSCGNVASAQS